MTNRKSCWPTCLLGVEALAAILIVLSAASSGIPAISA